MSGSDFIDNAATNRIVANLSAASTTLRSQGSALGSNLSIVQIRQDFSKNLINVLQTGSSNLTLADTNEEAANSQALSTRQSIAVSALALANTSQQSVLQLLREHNDETNHRDGGGNPAASLPEDRGHQRLRRILEKETPMPLRVQPSRLSASSSVKPSSSNSVTAPLSRLTARRRSFARSYTVTADTANTPARRLYFCVQMMYPNQYFRATGLHISVSSGSCAKTRPVRAT